MDNRSLRRCDGSDEFDNSAKTGEPWLAATWSKQKNVEAGIVNQTLTLIMDYFAHAEE